MLTGHLPFEATLGPTVLKHQLLSPIPPPSWLEETLDPRLEAVVLNATRKRPENRYASMQELLVDLDAVLGLSERDVVVRPLERSPDVYEPSTERGREALALFSRRFTPASIPAGAAS
jgi:serine/threonine-protein kinase